MLKLNQIKDLGKGWFVTLCLYVLTIIVISPLDDIAILGVFSWLVVG